MKRLLLLPLSLTVWFGLFAGLGAAPNVQAQYRAPRQYMQRLSPPPAQPQPSGTVAPVPPPVPGSAPADPAKAQADKQEAAKRTVEILKKGAQAGSASAQYELGKRCLAGDGVETNRVEARKWFEAAAKQEHEGAVTRLKQMDKEDAAAKKTTATGRSQPASAESAPAPPK
jgi:TPR repeat protein